MKKAILYLILILSINQLFSQITTTPTLPTANAEITITFDATGTGLQDFTGDVYAHTGLTVGTDHWQNVIESWGDNDTQPKLTRLSANSYELVITPTVYSYYSVDTSTNITGLDFVFRSADSSQQTTDLAVQIYEEGLNITITSPNDKDVFDLNDNINISAESSIDADLELLVNSGSIKTETNSKTISSTYTFTSTGLFTIKATAVASSENVENEISVYVKTPTQNETQPAGLKYGINKNPDNSVTFLLKAPNKSDVFIIGDFNDWSLDQNYQMKKDGDDFWLIISGLDIDTEYAYQYHIDYEITVADPYSEKILDPWTDQYIKAGNYPNLKSYPTGKTEGYVSTFLINETDYSWQIADFDRPSQDNLIIYELHIRDFVETDSYIEALTKLDYLEGLGVNAIELMPINEFEGADSWGYNPALYFSLDKAYGTKNKFKEFVDECHNRGIAVLADVVFNHSYGQSPMVKMYWNSVDDKPASDNPWYNEDHNFVDNTSAHWGYDFNHESTYTVEFFNDVLSYWMTEYKIDGFRFDFTKGFSNTQWSGSDNWASAYDATRVSILKNYADQVWNHDISDKPYVIFEHLSENSEETELANYGIMLWGNMNHNYNQNTMGWTTDTDISWISYKQRNWNDPNVVGYMESHDEERLMYKNLQYGNSNSNYSVKDLNTALSREELAGMFFFTIPGPKMIWQFGELGYDYSIEENGRVGRKPIRWDYFNDANRKHIYDTWSTLIEFKKKYPDVFNSNDFSLDVSSLTKSIVLRDTSIDVVIVGNFDIVEQLISTTFTETGTWYEYFTGEEKSVSSTSQSISLEPGEYKMYSTQRLLDPRGGTVNDDSDNDGVNDVDDLCPNTMEGVNVDSSGCEMFVLNADNFLITVVGETCPDENNGQIIISATEDYNYSTLINNQNYSFTTNEETIENLPPDDYEFCISVEGQTYEQCYYVTIEEGVAISGKTNISSGKMAIEISNGTAPFEVFINGQKTLETKSKSFDIQVFDNSLVEIQTAVECEGKLVEKVNLIDEIAVFPNPASDFVNIYLLEKSDVVRVDIFNVYGKLVKTETLNSEDGTAKINIQNLAKGLYVIEVNQTERHNVKFIKN